MSRDFNTDLIEGLWKCRNRDNDTPEQRESLRSWLRECVRLQRQRRGH